jgi:hypothetical protein
MQSTLSRQYAHFRGSLDERPWSFRKRARTIRLIDVSVMPLRAHRALTRCRVERLLEGDAGKGNCLSSRQRSAAAPGRYHGHQSA